MRPGCNWLTNFFGDAIIQTDRWIVHLTILGESSREVMDLAWAANQPWASYLVFVEPMTGVQQLALGISIEEADGELVVAVTPIAKSGTLSWTDLASINLAMTMTRTSDRAAKLAHLPLLRLFTSANTATTSFRLTAGSA